MNDFYADTDKGLPNFKALLDRLAEDAGEGDSYVFAKTGLAGGEGWLNDLSGAHDTVIQSLRDWLQLMNNPAATGAAGAVQQAINSYTATDESSAASIDETIESLPFERVNPGTDYYVRHSGVEAFADVVEPQDRYEQPPDYNSDYPHEPSWADALSPASLGRDVIWAATDFMAWLGIMDRAYDPYEFVLKPVIGDWAGFRRCSDVFTNVGDACSDMVSNLYWAENCLPGAWRGNAADAVSTYLRDLSLSIGSGQQPLADIAEQYKAAAGACHEFRNAAGTLISVAIDQAIIVAAAASAGGASAPTIVGPLIGGTVAAYEAYRLYETISAIMDAYTYANGIIAGVNSAMGSFGQINASDFYLRPFPETTGDDSPLSSMPS